MAAGRRPGFFLRRLLFLVAAVLSKFGLWNNDRLKAVGVRLFLRGIGREEILNIGQRYAKTISLNRIYQEDFLVLPPEERVIISASFMEYMQFVFPNERLFASSLEYDLNGVVTGLKSNLYGATKPLVLREHGIHSAEAVYTDSFSDQPLMDMGEKVILVQDGIKKVIRETNT